MAALMLVGCTPKNTLTSKEKAKAGSFFLTVRP